MKQLAATWEQAQLTSKSLSPVMDLCTPQEQDAILELVQIFLSGPTGGQNDVAYAGDLDLKAYVKAGTIELIKAFVNHSLDNPAGTGSLASESIGSISVSHTMAYNNADFNEWLKGNTYGKAYYQYLDDATPITGVTL